HHQRHLQTQKDDTELVVYLNALQKEVNPKTQEETHFKRVICSLFRKTIFKKSAILVFKSPKCREWHKRTLKSLALEFQKQKTTIQRRKTKTRRQLLADSSVNEYKAVSFDSEEVSPRIPV